MLTLQIVALTKINNVAAAIRYSSAFACVSFGNLRSGVKPYKITGKNHNAVISNEDQPIAPRYSSLVLSNKP